MALSAIDDILAGFPGWTTEFHPVSYDETSKTQGGDTLVKGRGPDLWNLTATSRSLSPNELEFWRARLASLDNGKRPFWGYSLTRTYPSLYPNGSWPTGNAFNGLTSAIASLGTDNKSLALAGLPNGFSLAVGDLLSFEYTEQPRYALHQLQEAASAPAGTTGTFEVRPFIQAGAVVGATVRLYRPRCLMMLSPGSIASPADLTGRGTVSFQGVQIPREF